MQSAPTTEIEKVIQEGIDMEALVNDDKFKKCITEKFETLSKNLVKNYTTKSDDIKTRIEIQMTMISAFENFCEGTVQAGKMAAAELESYREEEGA